MDAEERWKKIQHVPPLPFPYKAVQMQLKDKFLKFLEHMRKLKMKTTFLKAMEQMP